MLIGLMSDSHGKHLMVRQAVALFDGFGIKTTIHCGDVGDVSVFDELAGRDCTFVWGNTDDPNTALEAYVGSIGLSLPTTSPVICNINGRRAAIFHGHERGFESNWADLGVHYVFHGHTHLARDETIHGIRIINPGALHRAQRKTVAVLDTDGDSVTFYEIPEQKTLSRSQKK